MSDAKQMGWDEYFMNIADEVAKRSKDPSSKNGCVIVDAKHRPVSFGYNGMLQGADESKIISLLRGDEWAVCCSSVILGGLL